MREILFRGKRSDSKGWIEGLPTYLTEYAKDMNEIDGIQCNRTRFNYDIHFETVGQFTGLTDKNGTKIFEGDIIEEGYNNMAGRWVTKRWIVKWNQIQMAWMCYSDERSPYPTRANVICTNKNVIKVVGNIHDNKDLIE